MKPSELQSKLKALRLGGMLQTLELRRSQAEDQRLGQSRHCQHDGEERRQQQCAEMFDHAVEPAAPPAVSHAGSK